MFILFFIYLFLNFFNEWEHRTGHNVPFLESASLKKKKTKAMTTIKQITKTFKKGKEKKKSIENTIGGRQTFALNALRMSLEVNKLFVLTAKGHLTAHLVTHLDPEEYNVFNPKEE